MGAYEELMEHRRGIIALASVSGLLGWDQETMMPPGAGTQRAECFAAMARVLHGLRTDPRIPEWLAAIDEAGLDQTARANLRHVRRDHRRSTRVPVALAAELAQATSEAQITWSGARAGNDFDAFAPTLERVLRLKREEAAALAEGGDPYDALLDEFEPGMTAAELEPLFGRLRAGLAALRERILGSAHRPPALRGRFAREDQLALARELAGAFGYDWERGRLDLAVHPFTSGSGLDVRITTRVREEEPFDCFFSTIHETGHACYEQNIDPAYRMTPLGEGASMGVHESQSRICENQIGRGRAFCSWLYARMGERFGAPPAADVDAFYATANRVTPGFIRTEADEVHYNLHILLRFALERELIAGRLEVTDLQEAWNERFRADFGRAVRVPAEGVLQDVHWAAGLFGYFPTYALGNVYAGCLYAAMRAEVPELDGALGRGDARPATAWLERKVHRTGSLLEPRALIERAAGAAVDEAPLLAYLQAKFGEIYGL